MGEAIAIFPTTTGLLLVTCHPIYHADLVLNNLLDILLVVVEVLPVTSQPCVLTSQPCVLTVELLLDDVVPLLQAFYQRLVVGNKELDVLPILARLLFKMVALEMQQLQSSFYNYYDSNHHYFSK